MNEFFARERLSAYIDGELSASEMAEVDSALKRSPELRQEYDGLMSAVHFVRDHGEVQAPPDFHARVLSAVEDEPMPGGLWLRIKAFFTPVPMESLAVAVAAVLVAVLVGRNMNDEPVLPDDTPEVAAVVEPNGPDAAIVDAVAAVATQEDAPPDAKDAKGAKDAPPAWAQEMAELTSPKETAKDDRVASATLTSPEDGVVKLDMGTPMVTSDLGEAEITEPELKSQLKASQSMQLNVANPDALRDLLMIVMQYGGTAVDSRGRTVDEDALLKAGRVGVSIMLPQENVSSFTLALQQIGSVTGTGLNEAGLYSADQKIGLYVEVVSSAP